MTFTDHEYKKIDNLVGGLCRKRSRALMKHELRFDYEVHDDIIIILECRPLHKTPDHWLRFPMVKIHFRREESVWDAYRLGSNGQWLLQSSTQPGDDLLKLVNEIGDNPKQVYFSDPVRLP